jgi:hypothetical protein
MVIYAEVMLLISFRNLRPLYAVLLLACCAASAEAQERSQPANSPACAPIAESYVHERLPIWQQRLALDDWKISIVMSRRSDLKPKTLGNIRWDADTKSATIRVLGAAEYKKKCGEMLDDMEFTVVHELIHLELSSLPRSEESRRVEEHAVNRLADALLKLDRNR